MQEKTEMNGFFVGKRICTEKRKFIFAFVHNSECCWILVFNLSISEMAYSCVTKFNAENLQLHWFSRVILSNEWHFYLCHCSYEINLDLCFFNVKQQLRRVELLKKKKKMKKKQEKWIGSSHNKIEITTELNWIELNDRHTQQLRTERSWQIRLKVRKVKAIQSNLSQRAECAAIQCIAARKKIAKLVILIVIVLCVTQFVTTSFFPCHCFRRIFNEMLLSKEISYSTSMPLFHTEHTQPPRSMLLNSDSTAYSFHSEILCCCWPRCVAVFFLSLCFFIISSSSYHHRSHLSNVSIPLVVLALFCTTE